MRKLLITIALILSCTVSASAMEFTAPPAPESAEPYLPSTTTSFSADLWYVLKTAVAKIQPDIAEAVGVCISLVSVVLLLSLLQGFIGTTQRIVQLAGTIAITLLLVRPSNSLIKLGVSTIEEISEYGKLLIPVMTAALAAQGGTASSAALYSGTVLFDSFLTMLISKLLVPMIYIYIVLIAAHSAIGEDTLKNLRTFIKWLMSWCLKIPIYLFTGYMGITGVVSGSTNAAALKAAKLAISGCVPIVGNIISDASEAVLVSAGVMKSAVGTYGLIAMLAVYVGPFLRIGIHYILLKLTAAVTGTFGCKQCVSLIDDFSGIMGFLLAMTGSVCLFLLISTVCFMKGVS